MKLLKHGTKLKVVTQEKCCCFLFEANGLFRSKVMSFYEPNVLQFHLLEELCY